jgi:hypothetical protein
MTSSLRQIWRALLPSWLSGLVAGVVSLAAVAGTIIVTNYEVSGLRQEIFEAQNSGTGVQGFDYQAITNHLAQNQLISNLPLFLFWAALGVVVYLLATGLWSGLANAEELREELDYVNAPRQWILRTILIHLTVRLMVLVLWVIYLQIFLRILLPYVLAAAHVAATSLLSFSGIGYALLALVVGLLALHVHVVLLRLLLLKVRVFGAQA